MISITIVNIGLGEFKGSVVSVTKYVTPTKKVNIVITIPAIGWGLNMKTILSMINNIATIKLSNII